MQGDCLWEEEGNFQVEDDEKDCYQVEVDIEFYLCIVECFKVIFIGGDFFWVWF